jgi:hypothetical protein
MFSNIDATLPQLKNQSSFAGIKEVMRMKRKRGREKKISKREK